MTNPQLEAERAKYCRAYELPNYAMSKARFGEAVEAVTGWDPGTLLDIGCGRGEFLREMSGRGFTCCGTETVPELIGESVIEAWGHALPYANDTFDYVTSWDVLEHTVPGDETRMLREMRRVARSGVAFSANNLPSNNGTDVLHINIRSYGDWNRLVHEIFKGAVVWYMPERYSPIWRVEL